jgi:hypothetical protein
MELVANSPQAVELMKKKKKSNELKKGKKKKNREIDNSVNVDSINGVDEEEADFWMPPVGERWDFDDGKDRWESCESTHPNEDSGSDSG